jgi:hypothetical protein
MVVANVYVGLARAVYIHCTSGDLPNLPCIHYRMHVVLANSSCLIRVLQRDGLCLTHTQAKEEVKKIIATYQSGDLEQQPGRTIQESFENRVNAVLNKARDDAGKRAQNSLDLSVSARGVCLWCVCMYVCVCVCVCGVCVCVCGVWV